MNATLAYQIGAVFILAAMFMAGSKAKSLLGLQTLRAIRTTALVAGGVLLAYTGYLWWPDIYVILRSAVITSTQAAPVSASVEPTPVRARTAAKPVVKPEDKQYILYTAPDTPAVVNPPVSEETPTPEDAPTAPAASRGKRAIRSVGHFLHIGPKK